MQIASGISESFKRQGLNIPPTCIFLVSLQALSLESCDVKFNLLPTGRLVGSSGEHRSRIGLVIAFTFWRENMLSFVWILFHFSTNAGNHSEMLLSVRKKR